MPEGRIKAGEDAGTSNQQQGGGEDISTRDTSKGEEVFLTL